MQKKALFLVVGLIILAALSRLFPIAANFSPIAAIALMGGFFFKDLKKAVIIPLACLLLSDTLLHLKFLSGASEWPGFYPEISAIYMGFVLVVLIGRYLIKQARWVNIIGASLAGSLAFFLLSNFGVWMSGLIYPMTGAGLVECFVAAIPFFRNSIAGDLVFTIALFGVYKFAINYYGLPRRSEIA